MVDGTGRNGACLRVLSSAGPMKRDGAGGIVEPVDGMGRNGACLRVVASDWSMRRDGAGGIVEPADESGRNGSLSEGRGMKADEWVARRGFGRVRDTHGDDDLCWSGMAAMLTTCCTYEVWRGVMPEWPKGAPC